jgi:hypothetical protein
MPSFAILRIAKIKTLGNLAGAATHVARSRPTPNADPSRHNLLLAGDRDAEAGARAILATLPRRPRKNAVLALEVLATASPGFFAQGGDADAWAAASVEWIRATFGAGNMAHATLHLDESGGPHIHAFVIPIDDNPGKRGPASRLNAGRWVDGRDKLSALQDSYAAAVADFGLARGQRGSRAKHTEIRAWYGRMSQIERTAAAKSRAVEIGVAAIEKCEIIGAGTVKGKRALRFSSQLPTARVEELRRGISPAWGAVWAIARRVFTIIDAACEQARETVERADALANYLPATAQRAVAGIRQRIRERAQ